MPFVSPEFPKTLRGASLRTSFCAFSNVHVVLRLLKSPFFISVSRLLLTSFRFPSPLSFKHLLSIAPGYSRSSFSFAFPFLHIVIQLSLSALISRARRSILPLIRLRSPSRVLFYCPPCITFIMSFTFNFILFPSSTCGSIISTLAGCWFLSLSCNL